MLLESLFQGRKSSGHIYVCLMYQLSLCDFSIGFWNCSKSVIFFELSRQCDIFWTVLTVWYVLNCSDSVIFFELFRQCDICCTVPTVWYLLSLILSLSWHIQCIIAFCTVVVTYKSIYIRMLLSLIQIEIQKNYCSSLCFLFIVLSTIFVFLSLFFIWYLCCLSLLKNSLKTPKG
jgi:hypothetical protein